MDSRREDQYLFPSETLAIEFCDAYDNKFNTSPTVPDWYIKQHYIGQVEVDKEQFEKFRYKGDLVKMPEDWEYED